MMCNSLNLDLVNMNAYTKIGEILSICSQDIERKQNFGVNQVPYFGTNVGKMNAYTGIFLGWARTNSQYYH